LNAFSLTDRLSWLALSASILLPLAMVAYPALDGGFQRLMFGISFVWILERRSIRFTQPDRKTAAQVFESGPVF
jgi:hypothetical protein